MKGCEVGAPPTPPLDQQRGKDGIPAVAGRDASGSTKDKIPPVYNKLRGSKRAAFAVARDPQRRKEALEQYRKGQRSAGDTSGFNLKVWK